MHPTRRVDRCRIKPTGRSFLPAGSAAAGARNHGEQQPDRTVRDRAGRLRPAAAGPEDARCNHTERAHHHRVIPVLRSVLLRRPKVSAEQLSDLVGFGPDRQRQPSRARSRQQLKQQNGQSGHQLAVSLLEQRP